MNEVKIKIYLCNKRSPLIFIAEGTKRFEELYSDILTKDFIKFGPLIINRNEIRYIEME